MRRFASRCEDSQDRIATCSRLLCSRKSLASAWLDTETYKLPGSDSTAELNRLTAADLQRVASRLFKDTPPATIAVGDIAQLKVALGDKVETRNDAKTAVDSAVPAKKP